MRYSEPLDKIGRLLTLAVRARRSTLEKQELGELFETLGEPVCRSSAQQNKVEALVGATLDQELGTLSDDWCEMLEENGRRVVELLGELRAVVSNLRAEKIPSAIVESGGVLLTSDLPLRGYGSGDFDILVDERDWAKTQSIFAANGWSHDDRRGRPTTRIEYQKQTTSREHWLEVGYRSFDRMYVPLAHTDRSAHWLERRVPARKNQTIDVLDPTDGLAHIAMHTSLHSYVRSPGLRLHVDADRLICDNEIDWPRFLSEIQSMQIPTRAFVTLAMASGLLATPVPDEVLESLSPGSLRWSGLRRLLAHERVITNGKRKLTGPNAVLLDMMLEERSMPKWAASILVPSTEWMSEHFDREREGKTTWRLHAERFYQLATRWRPR